jgi:hypothetical protein
MQYMQAKRGPGLILIYLYPKVGATHNPGNSYPYHVPSESREKSRVISYP